MAGSSPSSFGTSRAQTTRAVGGWFAASNLPVTLVLPHRYLIDVPWLSRDGIIPRCRVGQLLHVPRLTTCCPVVAPAQNHLPHNLLQPLAISPRARRAQLHVHRDMDVKCSSRTVPNPHIRPNPVRCCAPTSPLPPLCRSALENQHPSLSSPMAYPSFPCSTTIPC